jgi:hypothetical protein
MLACSSVLWANTEGRVVGGSGEVEVQIQDGGCAVVISQQRFVRKADMFLEWRFPTAHSPDGYIRLTAGLCMQI